MNRRASCLLLALLLLAGCDLDTLAYGGATSRAEKRVRLVLETVGREGESTSAAYQTAICTWWKDKVAINDSTEFGWAYEEFRKFTDRGSLRKGIRFEIEGSEEIEGTLPPAVIVRGNINGEAFELLVPEGKPISWKKAPPPTYG